MTLVDSMGPLGILSIPTDRMLTVLGPAQRKCMHSSFASAPCAFKPYSTSLRVQCCQEAQHKYQARCSADASVIN